MFKVENHSYQESIQAFIDDQGEKPLMPRIRSCFFKFKEGNSSCQKSFQAFLMFKLQNRSYQESVHAFIYVQGTKPFMRRIRSCFFKFKQRNCSCQEYVIPIFIFKEIKNHSFFIEVQVGKPLGSEIRSCFLNCQG
jgi:hypothetical protein